MKKSVLSIVGIIALSFLVAGCTLLGSSDSATTESTTSTSTMGAPAADQKSGTTTKTGVLTEVGGTFFLQEAGGTPKIVESNVVELSEYVGQTVTVSGQYSGDTLFIGSVE